MAKDLTKCDWVAIIDIEDSSQTYKVLNKSKKEIRNLLLDKGNEIGEEFKENDYEIETRSYSGAKELIIVEVNTGFTNIATLVAQPYVWLPELK